MYLKLIFLMHELFSYYRSIKDELIILWLDIQFKDTGKIHSTNEWTWETRCHRWSLSRQKQIREKNFRCEDHCRKKSEERGRSIREKSAELKKQIKEIWYKRKQERK